MRSRKGQDAAPDGGPDGSTREAPAHQRLLHLCASTSPHLSLSLSSTPELRLQLFAEDPFLQVTGMVGAAAMYLGGEEAGKKVSVMTGKWELAETAVEGCVSNFFLRCLLCL